MKEYFKGVVWPRETQAGPSGPVYRYVVVGMVVTDTPIEEFHGKNEVFLDGPGQGIALSLAGVNSRPPKFKLGDAASVLVSLSTA